MPLLSPTVLLQALHASLPSAQDQKVTRVSSLARPSRAQLPRWRLTQRDIEMVRAVHRYRALTARQIYQLFFQSPHASDAGAVSSRCQHRLRMLFQHGYLKRYQPLGARGEGRRPLVYLLDKTGAQWLRNNRRSGEEEPGWNPKRNHVDWPFLDHLLATNDVRLSVELASRPERVELVRWIDEQQLRSQEMRDYVIVPEGRYKVAVIADGYFHLSDGQYAYHHFLEVDMATETVGLPPLSRNRKTFARKVQAYLAYYRSGQYAQRYATQAMRVLVVTTSSRRMQNLRQVTESVGGGAQFWFTTLSLLNPGSVLFTPIWSVAGAKAKRSLLWREDNPQ
jgi:protein involved in plasmid replication-relaxation